MNHVVLGVVAFVAIALLTLGPAVVAPLAGVLLAISAITAAATAPRQPGGDSGVGDEPGPLRP
ncbi:hypothetical protein ACIPC2_13085 [Curtobacterium pusillum]|uniref:hypothetical protein n=1 Tax=Curtobacterium pusillum TaxID=69373 RepID=UPI00381E8769